ncbi:hypothetical protein FRC08_009259, partial [Ceratobasidium sp. 394]
MAPSKRSRQILRRIKAVKDKIVPNGIWKCPECSKLCSKQKGGVDKHKRRCTSSKSGQTPVDLGATPVSNDQVLSATCSEFSLDYMSESGDFPTETVALPTRIRDRGATNAPGGDMGFPEPLSDFEMLPGGAVEETDNAAAVQESTDPQDRAGIPELGEDDVWVRRHPASGVASSLRSHSAATRAQNTAPPASTSSIWPFQTFQDFKQTEVFVKHKATNPHIKDQLALEQGKPQDPNNPLTLRSAADVHAVLELAVPASSQFEVFDFETHYRGKDYIHRLRMRPFRALIASTLLQPELRDEFAWYPEQIYVQNPTDGTPMRLWEESWHGDDFWNLQNEVGHDTRILYIQLYMDATSVSIYGGIKVWPVYMWLGNIPSALRRKRGVGGGILVAYIPVVHKDKRLSASAMAELRVKIYHQAIMFILETIKTLMQHGEYFECGDGKVYFFLGVIAVISADYEELAKIAAILGARSGFPCPICLVPRALQGNLVGTWPIRTPEGTKDVLRRAKKAKTVESQKLILREQSLRITMSTFISLMGRHFSLYRAVAADPLHQIELGVFGHHMWPWILDHQLSDARKADLDER